MIIIYMVGGYFIIRSIEYYIKQLKIEKLSKRIGMNRDTISDDLSLLGFEPSEIKEIPRRALVKQESKEEMQKWRRLGWINDNQLLDFQDLLFKLAGDKLI